MIAGGILGALKADSILKSMAWSGGAFSFYVTSAMSKALGETIKQHFSL